MGPKMQTERPRVLFIPTESGASRETGTRRALVQLARAGLIAHVGVLSLNLLIEDLGRGPALARLQQAIREQRPDVVILHHPGRTLLTARELTSIRAAGRFALIYHEADPYDWVRNPLPSASRAAAAAADIVFVHGEGALRSIFRRSGARDVRWVPASIDVGLVSTPPRVERDIDVVMIANNGISRTPFRGHPGAKQRAHFVDLMSKRFGKGFRIYGRGWTTDSAAGSVSWAEQQLVLARSRVSANWDHYPRIPKYFSNRLPISLASGSVHFSTFHPGYDQVFPSGQQFVQFAHTPIALVDKVAQFLDRATEDAIDVLSIEARDFAARNFLRGDVIAYMLQCVGFAISRRDRAIAWQESIDLGDPSLTYVDYS